jgi:putative ATPase
MEQMSLFDNAMPEPSAEKLRPRSLEEYAGQEHLLGPGKALRRLIESDNINSMILWGPPGVGKTTLAKIIAGRTKADFITFSAVTSGIKEIKQVMEDADKNRKTGKHSLTENKRTGEQHGI